MEGSNKIQIQKEKHALFSKGHLTPRKFVNFKLFSKTYSIQLLDDGEAIGTNQCLFLPKAELKIKNSTKRQPFFRFVKFVGIN